MDWIIAHLRSAIEREWKIVCIEVGANEVVCRLMKQMHINTESTRLNPQTDEAEKKKGKTFAPVILSFLCVRQAWTWTRTSSFTRCDF